MRKTKIAVLFSVMMIITMLLSACGPATTPTETKTEADTQVTKETTAPEETEATKEISEAMRKGIEHAKKNMIDLKKVGHTIPHPIIGKFGAAEVLLRPAAPGTGVIAGGAVRAIVELGGVKDILTKVIGRTSNPINVSYATMSAVKNLRTPEEIRRLRGKDRKEA